jgi:hypothetical protein
MMSNDGWPVGRDGYTPFEEELVNAMRDFANSSDAPDFAPDAIMRGSARRRTRLLVTAGVAATFILAGGGTALAVTGNSGPAASSHPASGTRPTASSRTATSCAPTAASRPAAGSAPTASSHPESGCGPVSPNHPVTGSGPATGSSPQTPTSPSHPVASSRPATSSSPETGATPGHPAASSGQ